MEDDASIQKLYKMVLEFEGFNICGTANNGKEAVEMYKFFLEKPDIILMDYRMPIMDGIEATKELIRINSKSKILFVSADNSIKDYVLSLGIKRFLLKPFNNKALIENIKYLLKI